MNQVIPGCENEQHNYQNEAKAKTVFLNSFIDASAPDSLGCVEYQMSAVQHGNGKEIDQTEVDGERRRKKYAADDAALADFTGHLGDPDNPADTVGAAISDEDVADVRQNLDRQPK